MTSKTCFKCKENKPLEDFYKHPGMADGRLNKCKDCAKKDSRKTRDKNIDRYREYDRQRGNRQDAKYLREWREKYPAKHRAHQIVRSAIRGKRLFPEPCEVCGGEPTHAHHDDYLKPLNVRWLCPAHHRAWHQENGEGKNATASREEAP